MNLAERIEFTGLSAAFIVIRQRMNYAFGTPQLIKTLEPENGYEVELGRIGQ